MDQEDRGADFRFSPQWFVIYANFPLIGGQIVFSMHPIPEVSITAQIEDNFYSFVIRKTDGEPHIALFVV